MKKIFIYGLVGLYSLVFFTGCASKGCPACEVVSKSSDDVKAFMVGGGFGSGLPSISAAKNVRLRNTNLLQNAADLTLKKGYRYFAFAKIPSEKVNNLSGSLIHTAEDFIKTCTPSNSLNIFTVGNSPCGYDPGYYYVDAMIYIYKKQPYNITTYDAKKVKEYMIKHNLWREGEGVTEISPTCEGWRSWQF